MISARRIEEAYKTGYELGSLSKMEDSEKDKLSQDIQDLCAENLGLKDELAALQESFDKMEVELKATNAKLDSIKSIV